MKNLLNKCLLILGVLLTITINKAFSQVSFSYATPAVFTYGIAITPLSPTVNNGWYGTGSVFAAVAATDACYYSSATGYIYATSTFNNNCYIYNTSGSLIFTQNGTAYNYNYPEGIVTDASGTTFIASRSNGTVKKLTTGNVLSNITGITNPVGEALDALGNLYVTDSSTGNVYKIASGTTTASIFLTGFNNPWGIAIDASGNLFVSEASNNDIIKVANAIAGGNTKITFATGFNSPRCLAFDVAGNLFVGDCNNNAIKRISTTGTVTTVVSTGLSTVVGVSIDASGNIYASCYGSSQVVKYVPLSYSISPALPAGLSINSYTGVISGTPSGPSPSTNYTVTATNGTNSNTATLNITVNPPAPIVSYVTPQVYYVGTSIPALKPVNTGGPVGSYATPSPFATVINSNGVAIDASGNVYVTSISSNITYIYNSSGTLITTKSGYSQPNGIIIDASGNSYVANGTGSSVIKTTPGGVQTTITGSFSRPVDLTMDAAGNIYVTDYGNATIFKINAGSTTATTYITGITKPWGIVANANGDLYITSLNNNYIYKVPAGSTTPSSFITSGLNSPRDMVIDGLGNFYEADAGSGTINYITSSGTITTLLTGLDSPVGLAVDGSGNIYSAGYNFGTVYKSAPSGYNISPTLPGGLSFNKFTGVISGTPNATSVATNYTVTATNSGGSCSPVVNITVLNPTAPTAGNVAICGAGSVSPTASGSAPSGGTYNWYNSAAGGTLLQSSTSTAYTAGIVSTTTYYVSYTAGTYTTSRTPVTATINPVVSSPMSGAVFSYPFNGNANDVSGNNNNGIIQNGVSLTTDRYGTPNSAYSFNGTNQIITTSTSFANPGPQVFSISIWFNTTTTTGGRLIGFGTNQTSPGGQYDRHIYMTNAGLIYFGVYSGAINSVNTNVAYNDGKWHHVIATLSTSGMKLYVDGVLAASNTSYTAAETDAGWWKIGGDLVSGWPSAPTSAYFSGTLDDVAVYNRELSSSEIASANNQNLIGSAAPICGANTITLIAPTISGATYSWTDGTTIITGNPATFTASSSGNYILTVTGPAGCSSTATITPGTGPTFTWTAGAGNTNPANAANWNYMSANTTGQAPLFNGTESLIIPSGLSYYPTLTANESIFSLTINNGASLNLNGYTLSVGCNIYNSSGGQILYGSTSTAGGITFNSSLSKQYYYGSASGQANVANLTVNNSAAGTVSISGGAFGVNNVLTLISGNLFIDNTNSGSLTLMSNSTNSAQVAAIPTGYTITGNVNVQRYITSGLGSRGYRLLSAPVNANSSLTGTGNINFTYLNANVPFGSTNYYGAYTQGPGTGFTYNGSAHPIIYLYDESRPTNNSTFIAGKNVGIYSITGSSGSPAYSITTQNGVPATITSGVTVPIGNSYLFYFVGSDQSSVVSSSRIPDATTLTATGYLNQGNVAVKFWKTGSTTIPYDVTTGTTYYGINQVGNPYASTINLNTVYSDNYNASTNPISAAFYELIPGGNYVTYNASNGQVSDSRASRYIVSGQGFLVQATGSSPAETLTFKEDQKVAYNSSAILLESIPPSAAKALNSIPTVAGRLKTDGFEQALVITTPGENPGLHLQLAQDSTNFAQTGVYFSGSGSDKYQQQEDALQIDGGTPVVFLSSYSSDSVKLSINTINNSGLNKRIRLYTNAVSSGTFNLSLADIANIDTVSYKIYLVDNQKNDSVDLVHSKNYTFSINLSDTTSFGSNRFVLIIYHQPIPQYVLTSFSGQKVSNGVQLNWTAINAGNYTGYTLQKLNTNGHFDSLYSVQSDTGVNVFSFIDNHPILGSNTYRLAQNGFNGVVTYSKTITIGYNSNNSNDGLLLYPNPVNTILHVNLTSNSKNPTIYVYDIYNSSGLLVKHKSVSGNNWTDDVSSYDYGIYIMQVKDINGNIIGQAKFIKNNIL